MIQVTFSLADGMRVCTREISADGHTAPSKKDGFMGSILKANVLPPLGSWVKLPNVLHTTNIQNSPSCCAQILGVLEDPHGGQKWGDSLKLGFPCRGVQLASAA